IFFFSSRRRHTRFSRDWSSDVCSSDLDEFYHVRIQPKPLARAPFRRRQRSGDREPSISPRAKAFSVDRAGYAVGFSKLVLWPLEIGRASCRERVWSWVEDECG